MHDVVVSHPAVLQLVPELHVILQQRMTTRFSTAAGGAASEGQQQVHPLQGGSQLGVTLGGVWGTVTPV